MKIILKQIVLKIFNQIKREEIFLQGINKD